MSRTSQQFYKAHVADGAWCYPSQPEIDMKGTDMKMSKLFPSNFLKANDLEGRDVTVTIANIELQKLKSEHGDEEKPVVTFHKTDKSLVLNITNGNLIAELYGDDTDDWIGKPITLYPARVPFGGRIVDAIRVRAAPQQAQPEKQPEQQYDERNPPPGTTTEAVPFNDPLPEEDIPF